LIADPADVDNRFAGNFLRQGSANVRDHFRSEVKARACLRTQAQRLTASSRQSRQLVL
jgi:hypothetical protein